MSAASGGKVIYRCHIGIHYPWHGRAELDVTEAEGWGDWVKYDEEFTEFLAAVEGLRDAAKNAANTASPSACGKIEEALARLARARGERE